MLALAQGVQARLPESSLWSPVGPLAHNISLSVSYYGPNGGHLLSATLPWKGASVARHFDLSIWICIMASISMLKVPRPPRDYVTVLQHINMQMVWDSHIPATLVWDGRNSVCMGLCS